MMEDEENPLETDEDPQPADQTGTGQTGDETDATATTDADSNEEDENSKEMPDFFVLGVWFEGGLIVLALILGWFGICDSTQSLTDFDPVTRLQPAFVWGMIAMLPMLLLLWATLNLDFGMFKSLRKTVDEHLGPLMVNLSIWKIAILSVLAGVGEELLFRWSLQGGLGEYLTFAQGPMLAAFLIAILFGLCHYITFAYAFLTFAIGFYLGMVMVWSGTYLAPALAHALYDFVALLVVVKAARAKDELAKEVGFVSEISIPGREIDQNSE